jgi:hypothetical protein
VLSRLTSKKFHPVRGSLVLITYLIPHKNAAIAQGERFFFDIDVKRRDSKEWFGTNATVGGPNRLAHPFRVAINAKGGDCWKVYSWE